MKLSALIHKLAALPSDHDEIQVFTLPNGGRKAKSIHNLVRMFGDVKGPEDCPLLYQTPIFLIDGVAKDCPFWELLPPESKPETAISNIVFLDAFLDKLRVFEGWDFKRLAELVERIEALPAPEVQ